METANTSSSLDAELLRVALERLHPHPANPNVMDAVALEKLVRNIDRSGRYPPLVVRPHPGRAGDYQILDGQHRVEALGRLGHREALCFPWPCDDATALMLLATLNRLHGEDLPYRRAALLDELQRLVPREVMESLLPEDAGTIDATLSLLDVDRERLLDDLVRAAEREGSAGVRLVSFALAPEVEALVERAVALAGARLTGRHVRGRALAAVCEAYLEQHGG